MINCKRCDKEVEQVYVDGYCAQCNSKIPEENRKSIFQKIADYPGDVLARCLQKIFRR